MLSFLEKNLWVSGGLLVAGVVMVVLILGQLGGGMPPLKVLRTASPSLGTYPSAEEIGQWLAPTGLMRQATVSNLPNPFFTLHFQPAPPPPTKTVELTYQGLVVTSSGRKLVYIKVGEPIQIFTNGAVVIADHAIKDATVRSLVLTNRAGVTNVFNFSVKKGLEVPAS